MKYSIIALIGTLCACSTALTGQGSKVQLVTSEQASHCSQIKVISINQRTGPDKAGNATRKALNEAAEDGGNALFIVSNTVDWAEGASVVANVLNCK